VLMERFTDMITLMKELGPSIMGAFMSGANINNFVIHITRSHLRMAN